MLLFSSEIRMNAAPHLVPNSSAEFSDDDPSADGHSDDGGYHRPHAEVAVGDVDDLTALVGAPATKKKHVSSVHRDRPPARSMRGPDAVSLKCSCFMHRWISGHHRWHNSFASSSSLQPNYDRLYLNVSFRASDSSSQQPSQKPLPSAFFVLHFCPCEQGKCKKTKKAGCGGCKCRAATSTRAAVFDERCVRLEIPAGALFTVPSWVLVAHLHAVSSLCPDLQVATLCIIQTFSLLTS